MVWTAELWNLPESVPHEIVIKSLPVLNVSFENGIGTDGSARMAVPANYTRLDEICDGSADVQGLVRLYWDGEHAFSFFPDNRGKKYEEETGTLVDISGEGVASAMKWAVAFPYDYPAKPYKTFNHTYGGEGSDGGFSNGGAEDFNLNGGAESGTISPFQPTQTDSNFITPLSFQVSSAHVHTGSNSFYVIPNGIRSGFKLSYPVMPGESYEFSAYLKDPLASGFRYIMLIELGEDSTMVQGAGIWNGYAVVELGAAAYEGGASDGLWQTLYGEVLFGPDVNQTTVYFVYDDPVVGGGGSEFYVDEIVVAGPGVGLHPWIPLGFLDEFSQSPFVSRTGDNSILFRVNASSPLGGTGGMQKLTNLVVGKTYTFSGYTQHDGVTAQPIRMVARYPGWPEGEGPILGSMLHSIPTGIVDWTYIWVTFVATHPDIWVDWRYDAAGASPNFWFDDMAFGEGLAKDTIGKIYKDMMDDAVIDHAAEVAPGEPRVVLPWLDYSSFTTLLDSAGVDWDEKVSLTMPMGQNYSQMNNQTRRLGYELDVVPDGLDAWQLVIYNPNGMGTDYSLAATPGVVVGQGIDSGQFASLVRPANHVLGIGAEGIWSEQERAPSKVTLGRREFFVADLQTLDETTVIKKADETLSSFEKTSDGFKLTFNESTPTVPFIDYTYGDIVNVHLPSYGINGPYRVHKIHGDWANAGESTWTVDFGSEVVTVGGSTAVAVQKILQRFEPLSEPKISSGTGVTTEAGRGGVDPTFLVAAVDAAPHIRANADFRCSGSNDQREIQAAFDALPVAGGRVQLAEGTYDIVISGTFSTPAIMMPNNSELVGTGPGTLLSVSGNGDVAIRNKVVANYNLRVANLRLDMAGVTAGNNYMIYLMGSYIIEGCWFTGMGQSGQFWTSYIYLGIAGGTAKDRQIVSNCHFFDVYQGACT